MIVAIRYLMLTGSGLCGHIIISGPCFRHVVCAGSVICITHSIGRISHPTWILDFHDMCSVCTKVDMLSTTL